MSGSTRAVLLGVALAGVGVFTAAWTVVWLIRGSYLTAVIILGLAVWSGGFAAYFLYTALGTATPRSRSDAAGTLLRPRRIVDVIFMTSTAAVVLSAALYLISSPLALVDYVPTGVMRLAVPVGCGSLLLFGLPTLYRMIKHGGGGHLLLDPKGIQVWNGQWGSLRTAEWDEVEQVLDRPLRGSKPFNEVIVIALPKGRSAVLMSDAITGDGVALREWIDFYWKHAECRGELVDDRGIRRLADKDFTTD